MLATHSDSDMLVAVAAFVEFSIGLGDDRALTADSSLGDDRALTADSSLGDAAKIRPGNDGRI
jgi:hypothetical protein